MFWEHNTYLDPQHEGPPFFISADTVMSQASRLTLKMPREHEHDDGEAEDEGGFQELVWATSGLTKVRRAIVFAARIVR